MTNSVRPRLRDGVEAVVGMDDHVLLFDGATGFYHRLGSDAGLLVQHFDGSASCDDIAQRFSADRPGTALAGAHVEALANALHAKSLLAGDVPEVTKGRATREKVLPRFMLSREYHRVLAPAARLVALLPARPAAYLASLVALVGYGFGFAMLYQGGLVLDRTVTVAFLIALMVQLVAVLLHESWHGIVAAVNGHPIRGLGVAMLFWIAPVAYVDRTDSYRVRSRGGRVAIALAGIVSDGWVCGVTGLIAWQSDGLVQSTTSVLLTFQLLLLIANLNPFVPSDAVAAVEAGTGLVDVRGRGFAVLKARFGLEQLPTHLQRTSKRTRSAYLAYASLSLLFVVLLVLGFTANLVFAFAQALAQR